MKKIRKNSLFFLWPLLLVLAACQSMGDKDTIARLRNVQIEIKEEKIEGGLEKAMQSYQRFLEETPESALSPEAIRRLADLKIEKEYGTLTEGAQIKNQIEKRTPETGSSAPEPAASPGISPPAQEQFKPGGIDTSLKPSVPDKQDQVKQDKMDKAPVPAHHPVYQESEADFEKRATRRETVPAAEVDPSGLIEGGDDLDRASTREAIDLYRQLLQKYPYYERNDQVLYQMSRAYEELGRVEEAMDVMDRMVRGYPSSSYMDEVQFRRAEYFFTRKKYLDAEEAYTTIVDMGQGSFYYELALYKLGWTFYKQELYEEAQHRFIGLLDYKTSIGYDFEQTEDETEHKRTEDTFRVISLSFSNLGGADSVVDYFARYGKRPYEDSVYSHLAEFYFDKRRYADASATYNAFVSRNPFHKVAPNFHMRIIEIHAAGGFPSLVLESKKAFASTYGLKAEYWKYFEPDARPDVLGHLKTNLTDLANHYHACYQDKRQKKEKPANFKEALHWYREFLTSFPTETESPGINYNLANLLLENKSFGQAAVEYEKTAYDYPEHEKSSEAGYAAVYALREHLGGAAQENKDEVKRDVVRSSLKFADTFPKHEKAAIVLGAAADDLYVMQEYEQSLAAGKKLLDVFPESDAEVIRSAWLVIGHSSYELQGYSEAEGAYLKVLEMLPEDDKSRSDLVDNLAAAIYKQGEQANAVEDYRAAADHFLRIGKMAPTSKIRASAEYDGASALIQLKDWPAAATVLVGFRNTFPGHELQPEVTKKIAYVYRENGQLSLAASEYERIETESQDDDIRREALQVAAELYVEDNNKLKALEVYQRYVGYFPQPVEINVETRNKIAEILKAQNERDAYLKELQRIVAIDAAAGNERTPRTRYLAAKAGLVLAENSYQQFVAIKLVKPFEVNLRKKRNLMKSTTKEFGKLVDYEIGEVTAAATYYLAEIYAHFSKSLMNSERPEGLSPLELEQYELAIEEQAYPFEEKAISVHENNIKLIYQGVYNEWIDKSLQKLAKFMPARYDKPEENSDVVSSLETYVFAIAGPEPVAPPVAPPDATPNATPDTKSEEEMADTQTAEPGHIGESAETEDEEPDEAKETEATESTDAAAKDDTKEVGQNAKLQ